MSRQPQQPAQPQAQPQSRVYSIGTMYRATSEAITKSAMATAKIGDVLLDVATVAQMSSVKAKLNASDDIVESSVDFCRKYDIEVKTVSDAINARMANYRLVEELICF